MLRSPFESGTLLLVPFTSVPFPLVALDARSPHTRRCSYLHVTLFLPRAVAVAAVPLCASTTSSGSRRSVDVEDVKARHISRQHWPSCAITYASTSSTLSHRQTPRHNMPYERSSRANGRRPLPWWLRLLKHVCGPFTYAQTLIFSQTQGIVTGLVTLGCLHYRNAHSLYFVAASLATSFSGKQNTACLDSCRLTLPAKGLKKVVRQPRPPGSSVKKTSGMPSTHSS